MQKILVVDDAPLNRELLCEMLEDLYTVETAEDGEQALKRLREYSGKIAALLLDLRMPRMDGFEVLNEIKKEGWMRRIPVLIITGEHSVEVENECLELGVSDFIRKPFESSIVKRRVKNAVSLFAHKNQLEQKVLQQEATLRKQSKIIREQAEKLRNAKEFDKLMMEYRSAIMEVETRLKVLNAEFSEAYKRNPFESIKSRLKSPASIYEKLERKGFPLTVEGIRENLMDVAGLRVICSFPDDIYRLADYFTSPDDIILIQRKDYIKNPKPSGYRSLHLIIEVPIYLSNEIKHDGTYKDNTRRRIIE